MQKLGEMITKTIEKKKEGQSTENLAGEWKDKEKCKLYRMEKDGESSGKAQEGTTLLNVWVE